MEFILRQCALVPFLTDEFDGSHEGILGLVIVPEPQRQNDTTRHNVVFRKCRGVVVVNISTFYLDDESSLAPIAFQFHGNPIVALVIGNLRQLAPAGLYDA